jgi:hypothetical protein
MKQTEIHQQRKYISEHEMEETLLPHLYILNPLFEALHKALRIPREILIEAFRSNGVGTANRGYTIFWLRNSDGLFCQPKWVAYGADARRRKDKEPMVPSAYSAAAGYRPCLFNAHLLKANRAKDVALVESEKTALLCTLARQYERQYVWLAVGGSHLTESKAVELKGRRVVYYPDNDKAGREALTKSLDLLSRMGIEAVEGYYPPSILQRMGDRGGWDWADYLLCTDEGLRRVKNAFDPNTTINVDVSNEVATNETAPELVPVSKRLAAVVAWFHTHGSLVTDAEIRAVVALFARAERGDDGALAELELIKKTHSKNF